MLTVPEAARLAKRDPETVRRWIRAGKLAAHKVGTQHMIEEDALAEAMRGGPATEPTEPGHRVGEVTGPYAGAAAHQAVSIIDPWLTTIVGRIVRTLDPVRIILFGSRARGDQRPDSDYDLLVILDHVDDRRATRIEVRGSFADLPVSADILVASVDEAEGRVPGHPAGTTYSAIREGRTIYDRDNVAPGGLAQLIAEGRLTPALDPDWAALPTPVPAKTGIGATASLLAERNADAR
jgi:uncharacterized protein